MAQPLVTVALSRVVGGTPAAVVGGLAGPIEPGNRLAVLSGGDRNCGQQLRVGRVQQPSQQHGMKRERTKAEPALPARGRGIQLRKHLEDSRAAVSRVAA